MKKTYFLFSVLIAGIFLFILNSCSEEPLEGKKMENNADPVSYIKNHYLKDKDILIGKTIEWDSLREYKNAESIIFISVPVKSKSSDVIEELTFRIDNGKVSGHLWKFNSESPFPSSSRNATAHKIMESMTGTVSYISLEGSFRYEKRIIGGEFIDELAKGGGGLMDSPACKKCHGNIDEVIIPSPGGGPITFPPPVPPPPVIITNPPAPDPNQDKCKKAEAGSNKATDISKNSKFPDAKQGVLNGFAQNGGENGVGFGTNTPNGPLESTGVQPLGATSGNINNPFTYPTADMHNHPQNTPPSAGDVYSMMSYQNQHNTFGTRYVVLPNGTVYALTVTNADAFASFLSNYPPNQVPGFPPNFSGAAYNDWDDAFFYGNAEMALSYVLDKYNAGIALTKMDANGNFKKLNVTNNGNNTYTKSECP